MKITRYDKDALFLRTHMAEVTLASSEKVAISMNADGASILFHFPDAIYCFTLRAMMDEVLSQREQLEAEALKK